jgi:small subunit ribosomal protein S16
MAVKIRLTRKGKKKQPSYRVVVADSRAPRDGRYIEQIGRYDPLKEPSEVVIDNERAAYWLSVGAQPSDAVRKLLEISGAVGARTPKDPKVHVVGEEAQLAAEAEAEAEAEAAAEAETAGDEVSEAAPEEAGDPGAAASDEEEQS